MRLINPPLLAIFFSTILLISTACGNSNRKSQTSSSISEEANSNKAPDAMELHDKLMRSFSEDWMERESDPGLYPTYYGGSFIDNNGKFVVAVTGNSEENTRLLVEILGTTEFNVETVKYSYRQMMQVMDRIDNFLFNVSIPDDHPVLSRFAGAYPDVIDNRVKVLLTDMSDVAINAFKRDVSDSPIVKFEKGEVPDLF